MQICIHVGFLICSRDMLAQRLCDVFILFAAGPVGMIAGTVAWYNAAAVGSGQCKKICKAKLLKAPNRTIPFSLLSPTLLFRLSWKTHEVISNRFGTWIWRHRQEVVNFLLRPQTGSLLRKAYVVRALLKGPAWLIAIAAYNR